MVTVQTWVDDTRRLLSGTRVEQRDRLAADYTAGSGTLTVTYGTNVSAGRRLSIGLNVFYVWAVNGKTLTVSGGEDGSTDANASSGAVVHVAPQFSDYTIFRALNDDLASLSSPENGLFQVKTKDITWNSTTAGYNLASDVLDILEVRASEFGITNAYTRVRDYRVDRNADTSVFASGVSLNLLAVPTAMSTVRVLYRAQFTPFTAITDDVSTTGLPVTAYNLPPLGAAVALMAGREVTRNQTDAQPDPRRAAEVPAGSVGNSYRGLAARRQQRVSEEAARLLALYPLGLM